MSEKLSQRRKSLTARSDCTVDKFTEALRKEFLSKLRENRNKILDQNRSISKKKDGVLESMHDVGQKLRNLEEYSSIDHKKMEAVLDEINNELDEQYWQQEADRYETEMTSSAKCKLCDQISETDICETCTKHFHAYNL